MRNRPSCKKFGLYLLPFEGLDFKTKLTSPVSSWAYVTNIEQSLDEMQFGGYSKQPYVFPQFL